MNMYSNYIPSKVEDVEPNAIYTFSADSKDGIPAGLRDVASVNTSEINGVKKETWSASINGDELIKQYPTTPSTPQQVQAQPEALAELEKQEQEELAKVKPILVPKLPEFPTPQDIQIVEEKQKLADETNAKREAIKQEFSDKRKELEPPATPQSPTEAPVEATGGQEVVEGVMEDVIVEQQNTSTKEDILLEGKRQSDILIDSVKPELRSYAKKLQDFFLGKGPNPNTEVYNSETKTWENVNDFFENQDKKDIFYLFKLMFSNLNIKEIENQLKQHVKAMNFYEGKKPITPTEFIARLFEPSKPQIESNDVKLITTTTQPTLTPINATDVAQVEKIENASEKGRELALAKPTNKELKRAFDNSQDLSDRARKAGIYDGKTLKIGGQEITLDTPAKFKAFLLNDGNYKALSEAVKDVKPDTKQETIPEPTPKEVKKNADERMEDAKSMFVFPIGLNPKFKFDVRLPENVKRFFKKYFRPKGLWTPELFKGKRSNEGRINAQAQRVQFKIRDLNNAIDKSYPKGVKPSDVEKMNDYMTGGAVELPPNMYAPLDAMRDHIDELSRLMIAEGVIDDKLVPVFDKNMGVYTTRTYDIHNDPKSWLDYIANTPEGQQIRNTAVAWLRQETEAKADRAEKLADKAADIGDSFMKTAELFSLDPEKAQYYEYKADAMYRRADRLNARAEAIRQEGLRKDKEGIFDAQVEAFLSQESMPLGVVKKGNYGAKDLGVLKKRKDIPVEIRELMGEVKDPITNYMMSVAKMSALISNNQFLNEAKVQGLKDGTFTENEPKGKNTELIASKSSDTMNPLNGLYTTKEIAQAFKEYQEVVNSPDYIKILLTINGLVKMNKTLLSETTHIRNFTSNIIIEVANGSFSPGGIKKASLSQTEQIFGLLEGERKTKYREYIEKLIKLGVLGSGANYRDMMMYYDDIRNGKFEYQKVIEPKLTKLGRKVFGKIKEMYKAEDDFFKVHAFEDERATLKKAYGDTKTDEQLDDMAAEIVLATRINYDMAPKIVETIKRNVFFGTFPTFPAEVLRITFNIPAQAIKEMKSDNKVIQAHGVKRAGGFMAAMGLAYAGNMLSRYMVGIDDEEEEARKLFIAPWSQNSTLIWDGKDRYVDTGYTDAFNAVKTPFVAGFKGADAVAGAVAFAMKFLDPFISPEIGVSMIYEIGKNKDEYNRDIYNKNAEPGTQASQVFNYIMKKSEPGVVSQMKRYYKGETGELAEKGQKYSTKDEILNATLGVKVVTVDWDNAISFKLKTEAENIMVSNSFYNKANKELNLKDKEGRKKEAEITNLAVERSVNQLKDYLNAAKVMGYKTQKIAEMMKDAGVSVDIIKNILENKPYKNYLIILDDGEVLDRDTQRRLRLRP